MSVPVGSNVCNSGVQCLYQWGPMSVPMRSNVCNNGVQCPYQCYQCQLITNNETLHYLKISRTRSPLPTALHTAVYRNVKICVLAVRVSVGQSSVGQLLTGCLFCTCWFNSLQHSGHYMYGQWSLYVPPVKNWKILRYAHTLCLCVLCGSENKQPLFPYTTLTDWFL